MESKESMEDMIYTDQLPGDNISQSGAGKSSGQQASHAAQESALAEVLARADREELPVEEAFAALEGLVQKMEEEGISLEDSFACYEAGIRLVRYCNERIDRVEKKVQMLRGEGEAPLEAE